MVADKFEHIQTWVFDLDNTLYPAEIRLFDQIERKMTAFIMDYLGISHDQANALRRDYWAQYGTTLSGMMAEHNMPPSTYLTAVHDIDFSVLPADPTLRAQIQSLPGRKIVFTNGTADYASQVLAARGLTGIFDALYGIEEAGYHPKPQQAAFDTVFAADQLRPDTAAMFEDDPRNLHVPHALGMRTVHVAPAPTPADHIHHHTDDLSAFLARLL